MSNITQRNENILRRQVFPIPENVAPTGLRCIQLKIPDDDEHMAIFAGAIDLLCKWNSWQRDGTNNAALAAAAWRAAIYDNPMFELCDSGANSGFAGASGGDELMLRQDPANPCKLQTSVNGVEWCDWADISLCTTPSSQPGDGAEQPAPGGGQACYETRLQASGKLLIPTVVNTGDVLNMQSASGAGTDGTLLWFCPSGETFFAGTCGGGGSFDGSDPLPSAKHMAIIAKIGSTYYDLTSGSITVGAGIENEQVTVQVNDSTLSDNYGEYTLSFCLTNNQQESSTTVYDFRLGTQGWTVKTDDPDYPTGSGVWTPGVGWKPTVMVHAATEHRYGIYIQSPVASVTPSLVIAQYAFTAGQAVGGSNDLFLTLRSNTAFLAGITPVADTTNATQNFVSPGVAAPLVVQMECSRNNFADPSPLGDLTLKVLTVIT